MTAASDATRERPRRPRTVERKAEVVAALRESGGFLSAKDLYTSMIDAGTHIGLTTVYRALTAAYAVGEVEAVHGRGGARVYRYLPPAHEHHLRCRTCGAGVPFVSRALEDWLERLGPRHGFETVRHAVVLTGVCSRCTGSEQG
ncbi:Fur family transcriptional regulator [Streptomyces halstedii]|uniref:Fur family transcriptional regulator n=1 Tax=Streptomyces halstedii TaxID=1944 RepID=UPI0038093080